VTKNRSPPPKSVLGEFHGFETHGKSIGIQFDKAKMRVEPHGDDSKQFIVQDHMNFESIEFSEYSFWGWTSVLWGGVNDKLSTDRLNSTH
jgi:hypothetical protein